MTELEKIYNYYETEEDNSERELIQKLDKVLKGQDLEIWTMLRSGMTESEVQKELCLSYQVFRTRLKKLIKAIKQYGDSINYM